MKGKLLRTHLSVLVFGAALAAPAGAQQTSTEDLRKDIESIRETLRVIQKDIQEIKESLARSAPASSGLNVVLDLASNPVRGERNAKLTLVEFSDYQ